jgi:hypothetical protein
MTATARTALSASLVLSGCLQGFPWDDPSFLGSAIIGPEGGRLEADRNPCDGSCRPRGIDRIRRAACVDELDVHSPSGTRRYANGLGEGGVVP